MDDVYVIQAPAILFTATTTTRSPSLDRARTEDTEEGQRVERKRSAWSYTHPNRSMRMKWLEAEVIRELSKTTEFSCGLAAS